MDKLFLKKKDFSDVIVVVLILSFMISGFNVSATISSEAPESTSFKEVGNGAEPEFNGGAGFSLPLGVVQGRGGLGLPISLAYSSGARLNTESSWVGLGFNLGVGSVSRSVVGVADDYDAGFLRANVCDAEPYECNDQDYYSFSGPMGGGKIIFIEEADGSRSIYPSSWSKVKIDCFGSSGTSCTSGSFDEEISKWVITTIEGVVYVFEQKAYSKTTDLETFSATILESGYIPFNTEHDYDLAAAYVSNWYLTSVYSPDYTDISPSGFGGEDDGSWVSLSYNNHGWYSYSYPNARTLGTDANAGQYFDGIGNYEYVGYSVSSDLQNQAISLQYFKRDTSLEMVYLSSVVTPLMHASFNYDTTSRQDGRDITNKKLARLNDVEFKYNLGEDVSSSKVVFEYAIDSRELAKGSEGNAADGRLTLDSLVFLGKNSGVCSNYNGNQAGCNAEAGLNCYYYNGLCSPQLPETSFDYHGRDKPFSRYAWDWWGYYNGQTSNNNYLVSTLALYTGDWTYNNLDPIMEADENHEPSSEDVSAWSISRVDYGLGGSVEYHYELGEYSYEQNIPLGSPQPGGIRLASKIVNDGFDDNAPEHSLETSYNYCYGVAIQDLSLKTRFRPDWISYGSHLSQGIGYSCVEKILPGRDENGNSLYGSIVTNYETAKDNPTGIISCNWDLYDDEGNYQTTVNRLLSLDYSPFIQGFVKSQEYIDFSGDIKKEVVSQYQVDDVAMFTDVDYYQGNDEVDCNKDYSLKVKWGRPTQTSTSLDGVTNTVSFAYNSENGLLSSSTSEGYNYNLGSYNLVTDIEYAFETQYPGMGALNMYSQIYSESAYLNSISPSNLKSLSLGRWSNSDGAWRLRSTYSWDDVNDNSQFDCVAGDFTCAELKLNSEISSYDSFGQILVVADAKGNQVITVYGDTNYDCDPNYDSDGAFSHSFVTCVKDHMGNEIKTAYDDKYRISVIRDLNIRDTTYSYDEFDRLSAITLPGDSHAGITYEYWYAEDGAGIGYTPNYVKTNTVLDYIDPTNSLIMESLASTDGLGRSYEAQVFTTDDGGAIIQTNLYNEAGSIYWKSKPVSGRTLASLEINKGFFNKFINLFSSKRSKEKAFKERVDEISLAGYNPYYVGLEGDGSLPSTNRDDPDRPVDLGSYIIYQRDPLSRVSKVYPSGQEPYDEDGNYDDSALYIGTSYGNTDSTYRTQIITDELFRSSVLTYDKFGSLIRSQDANGNSAEYWYDALGRTIQVNDPQDRPEIINSYNTLGQLESTDGLDSGLTQFTYDINGNVETKIDAMGITSTYLYDAVDRLYQVDYSDSSTPSTYYYYDTYSWGTNCALDANGNEVSSNNFLCEITKGGNKIIYSYDIKGRVTHTTEIIAIGSKEYITSYVYYAGDAIKSVYTSADGVISEYSYNKANQLITVEVPGLGSAGYTYTDVGNINVMTTFDSSGEIITTTSNSYSCSERDWLCSINIGTTGFFGVTLFLENYVYDGKGNVVSMSHESNDDPLSSVAFTYDNLDRLLTIDNHNGYYNVNGFELDSIVYGYDEVGNRLSRVVNGGNDESIVHTVNEYVYDGTDRDDNRLDSTDTDSCVYSYDSSGNMVHKNCAGSPTTYNYDADNMITNVYMPDGTCISSVYDAIGRRVYKQTLNIPLEDNTKEHVTVWYSYGVGTSVVVDEVLTEQTEGVVSTDCLECSPGDTNADGVTNILDVILSVNIVLGGIDPTPSQFCAADYNGDGILNILDVVGLVNEILS